MLLLLDHETYPEIYKCGDNVVALRRGKNGEGNLVASRI